MKKKFLDIEHLKKLSEIESEKRVREARTRIIKGVYSSDFILDDLVDRFAEALAHN